MLELKTKLQICSPSLWELLYSQSFAECSWGSTSKLIVYKLLWQHLQQQTTDPEMTSTIFGCSLHPNYYHNHIIHCAMFQVVWALLFVQPNTSCTIWLSGGVNIRSHTIDINQFIITDCHPEALFPVILTGPLDLSMDYNIFFREFNLTETAHNCRRNFTIFIVKFSGT